MRNIILLLTACAMAGYGQTTVTATATPAALTYNYQSGASALPAAQTLSIRTSTGTPSYTTTISPNTALWVTATPDSGKMPASLSVRVNPTGLGVGTYSANVVVTITGVAAPVSVPVTLTVTAGPSTLTLSATTVSMITPPIPPVPAIVSLSTNGAPISVTITSGSPWLTVTPTVGIVLPGEQLPLTLQADGTGLSPQAAPYVGKVTIVAAGTNITTKSQTITVNLSVNSSAPTITSVWPTALPLNLGPQTITIRGTNFYSGTVVKLQGIAATITPTVLSSTTLSAVIPGNQLTVPGTLQILVSNPAPGGDSASSIPVTVANIPTVQMIGNVASYTSASVSPGELVTIFGTYIGPGAPASMSVTGGFVDTTLGTLTVSIDGQAAPIIYASQNQINVQVPYEVTQGSGKQVIVTNGSNPAATSTVSVTPTAPGIFTIDGSGVGQAAALNYNATTTAYSFNSSTNMAKTGDTVILYVTGEGDYANSLLPVTSYTGYLIPSSLSALPQMGTLPTVTIGGATATVNYAGPVVGSIIGLLQLNAVVPSGSTTGTAVPVKVTIGGVDSQAGVTLGIRP